MPVDLSSLGFSPNGLAIPDRLIINLEGLEKSGKNWFAFSGRPPILFVSLDRKSATTAKTFANEGISILTYRVNVPEHDLDLGEAANKNVYRPVWEQLYRAVQACWDHNDGTLVIDTATELNEILCLALFGKTSQIPPHLRMEQNQIWRRMITRAENADRMSTVFVHKLGDKFDSGGVLERKGWGQTSRSMEYACEANVRVDRDPKTGTYSLQIRDCGPCMDLAGSSRDITNDQAALQILLDEVYA